MSRNYVVIKSLKRPDKYFEVIYEAGGLSRVTYDDGFDEHDFWHRTKADGITHFWEYELDQGVGGMDDGHMAYLDIDDVDVKSASDYNEDIYIFSSRCVKI